MTKHFFLLTLLACASLAHASSQDKLKAQPSPADPPVLTLEKQAADKSAEAPAAIGQGPSKEQVELVRVAVEWANKPIISAWSRLFPPCQETYKKNFDIAADHARATGDRSLQELVAKIGYNKGWKNRAGWLLTRTVAGVGAAVVGNEILAGPITRRITSTAWAGSERANQWISLTTAALSGIAAQGLLAR